MRVLLIVVLVLASAPGVALGAEANTGRSGSPCVGVSLAGERAADLDTTSLGRLAAPYEIGTAVDGSRDRVMMLVHGGGWYQAGPGALATMRETAAGWREAGWATVNVDPRACRRSVGDVLADAGPTDLRTIADAGGAGPRRVAGLARAAFGRRGTRTWSPVRRATRIRARLLLVGTQDDPLVPFSQQTTLADRVRAARPDAYVDAVELAPGSTRYVHGTASPLSLAGVGLRTAALVAPFGRAPGTPPPFPTAFFAGRRGRG